MNICLSEHILYFVFASKNEPPYSFSSLTFSSDLLYINCHYFACPVHTHSNNLPHKYI